MHVLAIMGTDTPQNREKALSAIKSEKRSAIIQFFHKGDRKLRKKVEKYKKKHPKAVIKNFE